MHMLNWNEKTSAAFGITAAAFAAVIGDDACALMVGDAPLPKGGWRYYMHADGMIDQAPELIVDVDASGNVELWINDADAIYPVTIATGKIGHSHITIDRAAVRKLVSPDMLDD